MNLNSIPAFQDNYIWVLNNDAGKCLIVDPGETAPLLNAIEENGWQPEAILLTHHHKDHTGGVKALLKRFPGIIVYGPQETAAKGATSIVNEGDKVSFAGLKFDVIATPGHTAGHVCYYAAPYLFSGDTLFSGGCGRLFEGTAEQMYKSFHKLNALPAETLVCCGHEYTLSNLAFAANLLPQDAPISQFYAHTKALRAKNQPTLPSTLKNERRINVFLLTQYIDFIEKIKNITHLQQPERVFAWLRSRKDNA